MLETNIPDEPAVGDVQDVVPPEAPADEQRQVWFPRVEDEELLPPVSPDPHPFETLQFHTPDSYQEDNLSVQAPFEPPQESLPIASQELPQIPVDQVKYLDVDDQSPAWTGNIDYGQFYEFDLSEVMDSLDVQPLSMDMATMMLGQKDRE